MNNTGENSIIIDDDDDLIDDSMLAEFENSGLKEFGSYKEQTSNVNKSINQDISELNVSALCCDEEFSGFDKLTGKKWIYPNNYPVRDYQFNIIKAAISKNTLVSLPTGLGKTFIAAVLMYNFYRWYPLGKVVFTAPTRPLIAQQIEACYNIIALPPGDTIEMTGSMNVNLRKENWRKKRVFFATPQVVYNDIKSGICPGKKIRCLVIDEAHKAKSNYAYCHIVSTLTEMEHRTFRILALSATPGSRINDVVQVVKNLHIAHLELRSENCIDVAPYCYYRNINTVVVPLGPELSELRQKYIEILDSYARKLIELNILKSSLGNLSKGRILMIYKEFQTNSRSHPQRSYIMLDLSRLISLYHAFDLLVSHGSRSFLNFFDEHSDKTWIQSDARIMVMLEKLRQTLGINPLTLDTNIQPDGSIPQVPTNLCFGHPKFTKVREIMEEHFKKAKEKNEDTRAIVFCEYHETVKLVHCLLLQCRPLINPRTFVGQGASGKGGRTAMPQREQLQVMRLFREGACNALVATCVAEEGLDVGSVDLIVCFDVATRSPIRLVQRCGRTGRERSGQVHFLVTEGKEHQVLLEGMRQRDSLKNKILQSKEVQESLYTLNPRLIPYEITPRCEKMFITVKKAATSGGRSLQNQEKSKKNQMKKQSLKNEDSLDIINSPNKKEYPTLRSPKKEDSKMSTLSSVSPKVSPLKTKQKEKCKVPLSKPNKKNADIRALFLAANKSKQGGVKVVNELLSQNVQMSTQTLDLYFDLAMEAKTGNTCYICASICDCRNLQKLRKGVKENYKSLLKYDSACPFPDINLIDDFNAESMLKSAMIVTENDDHEENESIHNDSFFPSQCNGPDDNETCVNDECKTMLNNFDIGDFDDIFVLSPREAEANKANENKEDKFIIPSISFDLGSFDDLEENTKHVVEIEQHQTQKECAEKEQLCSDICTIDLSRDESPEPEGIKEPTRFKSPSILSGSRPPATKSPILTTQPRKLKLKRKSGNPNHSPSTKFNARKQLNLETEEIADASNSMLSITQTIDLINSCNDSQPVMTHAGEEGRLSPIISTQADKKKKVFNNNTTNKTPSEAQVDVDINVHRHTPSASSLTHKRKVDDVISSPYFNKKTKYDDQGQSSPSTLQEKIFAILTSNDLNNEKRFSNDVVNLNCTTFVSKHNSKENKLSRVHGSDENKDCIKRLFDKFSYTPKKEGNEKTSRNVQKQKYHGKLSKKKKTKNSFIESEAELSEGYSDGSADELTDDSVGSIVDFIMDEASPTKEDMHALYLESVKSPIKTSAFKIPQLPKNFENTQIYSQFVEEDSYEMDSFCVDSHVGLTQANDLSSLELAEMVLEEERRRKKKSKNEKRTAQEHDSPVIKGKNKNVRRHNVISDSEDEL